VCQPNDFYSQSDIAIVYEFVPIESSFQYSINAFVAAERSVFVLSTPPKESAHKKRKKPFASKGIR
jgi:hypothetical protein